MKIFYMYIKTIAVKKQVQKSTSFNFEVSFHPLKLLSCELDCPTLHSTKLIHTYMYTAIHCTQDPSFHSSGIINSYITNDGHQLPPGCCLRIPHGLRCCNVSYQLHVQVAGC